MSQKNKILVTITWILIGLLIVLVLYGVIRLSYETIQERKREKRIKKITRDMITRDWKWKK